MEPILPLALLYLFGAGHVAQNIYKIANIAGFQVCVIDDRSAYASRERFPEAHEVVAENFDNVIGRLTPSSSSYIVIVTRGHKDDMRLLRWAVQTDARYVGMIGSKRKVITIHRELREEGLPENLFESVYAPIGLDIGALTPEEIGVAACAEMIAVRRRSERKLPHMSWFLRRSESVDDSPLPVLGEENF